MVWVRLKVSLGLDLLLLDMPPRLPKLEARFTNHNPQATYDHVDPRSPRDKEAVAHRGEKDLVPKSTRLRPALSINCYALSAWAETPSGRRHVRQGGIECRLNYEGSCPSGRLLLIRWHCSSLSTLANQLIYTEIHNRQYRDLGDYSPLPRGRPQSKHRRSSKPTIPQSSSRCP